MRTTVRQRSRLCVRFSYRACSLGDIGSPKSSLGAALIDSLTARTISKPIVSFREYSNIRDTATARKGIPLNWGSFRTRSVKSWQPVFPRQRESLSSEWVLLFISRRASVFQESLPSARASSGSHARVFVMSPVRENRCPFKRETRSFRLLARFSPVWGEKKAPS